MSDHLKRMAAASLHHTCPPNCVCVCHQSSLRIQHIMQIKGILLHESSKIEEDGGYHFRLWAIDGPRWRGEPSVIVFVSGTAPESPSLGLPNATGCLLRKSDVEKLLALCDRPRGMTWSMDDDEHWDDKGEVQ